MTVLSINRRFCATGVAEMRRGWGGESGKIRVETKVWRRRGMGIARKGDARAETLSCAATHKRRQAQDSRKRAGAHMEAIHLFSACGDPGHIDEVGGSL